jgi:hypothetical protein
MDDQAAAPPTGLVDVIMVLSPIPTHRLVVGQDTLVGELSTVETVHADVPPVGLVDVTTTPILPTSGPPLAWPLATHRLTVGHDTSDSDRSPTTLVTVQDAVPPVGFVDVTTLVPPSIATQRSMLGQETPASVLVPSTNVILQAAAPPVGLLEVSALPAPSTATHGPPLRQDTPSIELVASTMAAFQAAAPPVGLVEMNTLPLPTPTQRVVLLQDTLFRWLEVFMCVTLHAATPAAGLAEDTKLPS